MAFEAGAHRASTEPALGNVPQVAKHCLENEVVVWRAETQAALKDIVAILVQKQGNSIGSKTLDNECHLRCSLADIDDLLSCPCAVLMYPYLREMRRDLAQHLLFGMFRTQLEQFLYYRVTKVVG